MRTAERLLNIMRILCRERHITVPVLAEKFGVSIRTIRRDIFELGFVMPLDTRSGKYDGGVYVIGDYTMDRMYMTKEETALLAKVKTLVEDKLTDKEEILFSNIIKAYTQSA